MEKSTTPMLRQYLDIKKQYQDCLLFYRMGDFYELFMEDARIGAQVLNITLTSKAAGKDGKIPMAGVPYHAVDTYLSKLVKAGYKVAICEQVSLPSKKGIVDREVVRIVTPGTVLDEKALEKKENNYIVSISFKENMFALSVADISTGYLAVVERTFDDLTQAILEEFSRLNPVECILSEENYNDPELLKILKIEKGLNIYCFKQFEEFSDNAERFLKNHFGVNTLAGFEIHGKELAIKTSAALLGYLQHTQRKSVSHIKKITLLGNDEYVLMDRSTMINLELFSTIREHDVKGSLLTVLDQTITAMGGRLLKQWLKKPLTTKEEIEKRLNAVDELLGNNTSKTSLRDMLKEVPDIERILSRLSVNIGNARDLVNLKYALLKILAIKKELKQYSSEFIHDLSIKIPLKMSDVTTLIESTIVEEPPIDLREGGLIKEGINEELDELRKIVKNSKTWIQTLEKQEKEKTGISTLKIRFNKVFGFYIEISKTNAHLAPKHYMRKQTLVNGERFITAELKKQEEIILSAEERSFALEYKLYTEVLTKILKHIEILQETAQSIAMLDCILTFSYLAEKNQYSRPKLLYSGELRIKGGRHPVVEKLLEDSQFVPNDVVLDNISQQLLLITGPNMAGKSVFIRQVAVIVLMAHIGCFVPASSALISIVDRIFVRSGASDVITSGLSTFMVEMVETAHILHSATKHSLIVMDEIGRGTSTYDGISIAWAVAEYLVSHTKYPPKTLFATHYHELQALEEQYPTNIKNYHMAVENNNGEPIFLHTILSGGASHSFGIAVAKLAGVPQEVIENAQKILEGLEHRTYSSSESAFGDESRSIVLNQSKGSRPFGLAQGGQARTIHIDDNLIDRILHKEVENLDIGNMTPIEALNKLAELKDKLKLLESTQKEKFLEAD